MIEIFVLLLFLFAYSYGLPQFIAIFLFAYVTTKPDQNPMKGFLGAFIFSALFVSLSAWHFWIRTIIPDFHLGNFPLFLALSVLFQIVLVYFSTPLLGISPTDRVKLGVLGFFIISIPFLVWALDSANYPTYFFLVLSLGLTVTIPLYSIYRLFKRN